PAQGRSAVPIPFAIPLSSSLRGATAMLSIVHETTGHIPAREALLDAAFGPHRRAKTSERLREGRIAAPGLAFSAVEGGRLVGTVRLWNVTAGPGRPALLLGPLAVDGAHRGDGIGAR